MTVALAHVSHYRLIQLTRIEPSIPTKTYLPPLGHKAKQSGKAIIMTEDRIATILPVEENQAVGKVDAIFEDIKQTKNITFVPALWRTIATNPTQLEVVWTTLKTLMHPEVVGRNARLDPKTREMIALAVSATNACPYCINSHTAALRKLGVDTETLGRADGYRRAIQHDQCTSQRLSG
jgi:AhpD family alkylhydroperoxidase